MTDKKLISLVTISMLFVFAGCSTFGLSRSKDYKIVEKTGAYLDVDLDDNDALDQSYGGTNATTAAAARTALGLEIGADIQQYLAPLDIYGAIDPSTDVQALLAAADNAAIITVLGLEEADATILRQADIDDAPVDGETTAPISSNWAYDLEANVILLDGIGQIAAVASGTPVVGDYIVYEDDTTGVLTRATITALLALAGVSGGWEGYGTLTVGSGTPTVSDKYIYNCTGATSITLTDFLGPTADLSYIGVLVNASEVTINFASNANIEGNSNVDFTGDASQEVLITFILLDGKWYSDLHGGWINPTTLAISAIPVETIQVGSLNDTTTPHLLTVSELQSHKISNADATEARVFTYPAQADGWDACFLKEADYNMTLTPNGTETFWFRTTNGPYTQMAAGESIVNTTSGKSTICVYSTDDGIFFTGDTNWEEETPP